VADFLEGRTRQGLSSFRHVIVLTHVPPFRDACWYEGKISHDDYLPHFVSRAVGDRLIQLMREHPDRSMTVLCGHTHSAGVARVLPNLVAYTAVRITAIRSSSVFLNSDKGCSSAESGCFGEN